MNIDLIEELAENIKGIDTLTEWQRAKIAIAADLMLKLADELKECQAQRRAAFRRIEELDRELDAMRAQIGQGVPVLPVNCRQRLKSEGKAYAKSNCASCGELSPKWKECDAMLASAHPAPQQKPHTA